MAFGYAFTWLKNSNVGAWEVNPVIGSMPQKVATALGELSEKLVGASYEPIAYLGKQQVNGTNYCVLAVQTIVTKDPHKNIVLMKFNEKGMDCTLYSIEPLLEEGGAFGGLKIDPKVGKDIDVDALKTFESVTEGWLGMHIEPIALLATRVVKGVELTFLAKVVGVYPGATPEVMLITVNGVTKTLDFEEVLG